MVDFRRPGHICSSPFLQLFVYTEFYIYTFVYMILQSHRWMVTFDIMLAVCPIHLTCSSLKPWCNRAQPDTKLLSTVCKTFFQLSVVTDVLNFLWAAGPRVVGVSGRHGECLCYNCYVTLHY